MIERQVVCWMILVGAVDPEDRELYEYAVECLILQAVPVLILLLLGTVFQNGDRTLGILIPLLLIRKYSGGYHMKKKSTCMVSSVCIVSICIKITEYIKCGFILFFITMGAVICLYCHSPVDNINRKLNCDEKRDCRKTTRIRVIACLAIAFLTYIFKMPQYTVCISLALILTAVLQLLAIAHNKIDRSACMKYLSTK